MAYTSHGQHIPGTSTDGVPDDIMLCGGPEYCAMCSRETVMSLMTGSGLEPEVLLGDNSTNYQDKAMKIVRKYIASIWKASGKEAPTYQLYVVWFTKTLQNWKALVGSTLEDGLYYEIIYNGDKKETYLDAYMKFSNMVVPD